MAASVLEVQGFNWILPVAAPIAFMMGWGMGANELSSNWGNVFGSRVVKLWQIVLVAAIFEFIGAISLGSGVASTIRGSILSTTSYADMPAVLMFGMLCVVITCAIWLFIVNTIGLPVSDSQTTVLSLIGVGLATKGWSSVRWDPGIVNIGIAWAVSPPAAAAIGFCLFFLFKFFILKHEDAVKRLKYFYPVFVFIILAVNFFFFMFETPLIEDSLSDGSRAAIAVGAAVAVTIVARFTYVRWLFRKVDELEIAQLQSDQVVEKPELAALDQNADLESSKLAKAESLELVDVIHLRQHDAVEKILLRTKVLSFLVEDVYERELTSDQRLAHVHHAADKYPVGVELMFMHLLILTACFKSFAHGASDVSNAVGPLAAIVNILEDGKIDRQSNIPFWTLVLGASAMSIGILTYGYKTLTMLGMRVTRISPVRGVCIDLAAVTVILVATYLKIPISTTQTTVFAIVGVGLATGIREKIHYVNLSIIVIGWAVTLIFSAVLSFSITSFGVRAPSI